MIYIVHEACRGLPHLSNIFIPITTRLKCYSKHTHTHTKSTMIISLIVCVCCWILVCIFENPVSFRALLSARVILAVSIQHLRGALEASSRMSLLYMYMTDFKLYCSGSGLFAIRRLHAYTASGWVSVWFGVSFRLLLVESPLSLLLFCRCFSLNIFDWTFQSKITLLCV